MSALLELDEVAILSDAPSAPPRTTVSRPLIGTSPRRQRWFISKPEPHQKGTTGSLSLTGDGVQDAAQLPQIALAPADPPRQTTSKLLGLWEGYVTSITADVFTARLVDIKDGDVDHEAEFDLASVSEFDMDLVQEGAVFYWSISYIQSLAGQRSTTSDIRFRRRPVWAADELRNPEKEAEFAAALGL